VSGKRRAWFQIHLSTAIVMMFVAGGLMWMNMRLQRFEDLPFDANKQEYLKIGWIEAYGWPKYAFIRCPLYGGSAVYREMGVNESFLLSYAAINLATAITILLLTTFLCERQIRRREARAP